MRIHRYALVCMLAAAGTANAQEARVFTNTEGKTVRGVLSKYDPDKREATLLNMGRIPLASFCPADRRYILQWNMAQGFQSKMRFKVELEKKIWSRMKWERDNTPYFLDAVQVTNKALPFCNLVALDDYEESASVNMRSTGYEIIIKNQNLFPIDNVVVCHRIFYRQEDFVLPESLANSQLNTYTKTVVTNKTAEGMSILPTIAPLEHVVLYSMPAITIDYQISFSSIATETGDNTSSDPNETTQEDLGDYNDSARNRKGEIVGVWVKFGIRGPDGKMIWRDVTDPDYLPKKVTWDFKPPELPEPETISEAAPASEPAAVGTPTEEPAPEPDSVISSSAEPASESDSAPAPSGQSAPEPSSAE